MKQKTALYFGSFNPVHSGHLAIAEYVIRWHHADEVWFVLSPMNPMKSTIMQADEHHRLTMLQLAIKRNPKFQVCDIELQLPKPSYTINTMKALSHNYPGKEFRIIMGMDNLAIFRQWKSWQQLLDSYVFLVYPRAETSMLTDIRHPNICVMDEAPLLDISSSQIRTMIAQGKDFSHLVPAEVAEYIIKNKLYC